MKNTLTILLQNQNVVSTGYYLKAIFSQWEIFTVIIIVVLLIYFIRKRRSK